MREEPDSIPSPCKFQVATAMAEQSGRMCGRFNSERLDTFATKFEIGRVTTSDQLSYRRCWTYRWFGKEAAKPMLSPRLARFEQRCAARRQIPTSTISVDGVPRSKILL